MYLAQLNIARAKYALDAPEIAEFVDNLDPVNATAEASDGFVWRLQDESGDATSIQAFEDPDILVNLSVWKDAESLKHFLFRTHHIDFLKRRKEWFHLEGEDTYVLWWVAEDHIPAVEEAIERLMHLREHGETPYAFSFKCNFTPHDEQLR